MRKYKNKKNMTERDFDKFFKDTIGDELPQDFRPNDWLAAEQELDKMLPISTPTVPSPRLLTWHKWAIAATVLLLGSQLYLMSELGKIKQEVVALHQENAELMVAKKADFVEPKSMQSVVIQHDTIVKTVFIEKRNNENAIEQKQNDSPIQRRNFDNFAANNSPINERNEAALSNPKNNPAPILKSNLVTKNEAINTPKTALQTVENSVKVDNEKINPITENKGFIKNELTENKAENTINSTDLNKENSDNSITKIDKENTLLINLPIAELTSVKSINKATTWLNPDDFDFAFMSKPVMIKPIPEPNGWEIGLNTLFVNNEEHRSPKQRGGKRDDDRNVSMGANVRLTYNLRQSIRLTADADFWSERHGRFDPNKPPTKEPLPPTPNLNLVGLNQNARSFQLRLGADYKLRQVIGLQPFVGFGVAFQQRLDDKLEYTYTQNSIEIAPISTPNEEKFNKPFSLSFRAGVEGKIYRRLGWNINLNAQLGNTLSSNFGLRYAL
jgi:hypothetical protein